MDPSLACPVILNAMVGLNNGRRARIGSGGMMERKESEVKDVHSGLNIKRLRVVKQDDKLHATSEKTKNSQPN